MAKRRVEVELLLQVRNYIGEAGEATVTTKVLSHEIHELGDEADATGRDLDQMAGAAALAKHEVEGYGRAAAVAGLETRNLDVEIVRTRNRLLGLQQAFARDPSKRGLLGDIGTAKRDLRELENISRAIRTDLDETAGDIFRNVSGLGRNLRGALIPTVIGLAALFAPALGAAVAGIVGGTFVGAGMAGGLISAWRQPIVKSQWETFKNEMQEAFFGGKSAKAFAVPFQQSLLILEKDFKDLHIDDAFIKAAPAVTILAHGIGDLAKNLMPGFNKLLDQSGAYTQAFADGLAGTGSAISDLLTDIADSPGSIEGLIWAFKLLNSTIVTTGNVLNFLADTFHQLAGFNDWLAHGSLDVLDWLNKTSVGGWHPFGWVRDTVDATSRSLDDLSGRGKGVHNTLQAFDPVAARAARSLGDVANSTEAAAHAADHYTSRLQNLDFTLQESTGMFNSLHGAILDVNQTQADLRESLKQNGKTFDENTQAGRDNARAWMAALTALQRWRESQINTGHDADETTRKYNAQVQVLLDMAAAAGASRQLLDELAGEYIIQIHTEVDWSTFRNTERQGPPVKPKPAPSPFHGHAGGGWDPGDAPFWAGEQGKELVFTGGSAAYVMNHRDSMAWAAAAPGGTVRHEHYLNVTVNGGQTRRLLIDDGKARGKSDAQMALAYP